MRGMGNIGRSGGNYARYAERTGNGYARHIDRSGGKHNRDDRSAERSSGGYVRADEHGQT